MSRFRRWNPFDFLAGFMILMPLFVLVFVLENQWWETLAAIWIVLWFVMWIRMHRRQAKLKLREAKDVYQQQLIQTMNHYRHDWMNELQVLFGYIRLKKYEYLLPYTEKIRDKWMLESAYSKLGIPSLIAFLMTFRSSCHHLQLNVKIDERLNVSLLPIDAQLVTDLVSGLLLCFQQIGEIKRGEATQLELKLEEVDQSLALAFQYRGDYQMEMLDNLLQQTLREVDRTRVTSLEKEYLEGQADITVRVPFRTI